MNAIMAGLTAWDIEFSIVISTLLIIRREEQKVINRRKR